MLVNNIGKQNMPPSTHGLNQPSSRISANFFPSQNQNSGGVAYPLTIQG